MDGNIKPVGETASALPVDIEPLGGGLSSDGRLRLVGQGRVGGTGGRVGPPRRAGQAGISIPVTLHIQYLYRAWQWMDG
jgi:hypothetical protein